MSGVVMKSNRTVVTETNQSVSVAFSTSSSSASTRIISKEENFSTTEYLRGFLPLVGVAQFLGLLPLFLIIFWIFRYAGGLKFPSSRSINWHILLLCFSFIYLNGNNILAFRILRDRPKNNLKLIHAIGGSVICVLGILGIWAAFPSKGGFFSYYTLHSWIGIFTMIIFLIQTIGGLFAFLYQGIEPTSRATLMPYHRYFGQILLILAIMAAVTGINEKAIFKLEKLYKQQVFEGVLLNLCGFLFVLFGIVVIYIAANLGYKRYPRMHD